MLKNLENGRKVAGLIGATGLFGLLRDGSLKAGDMIDVVSGTLQLIVNPFQKVPQDIVTAVTNIGSCSSPMQVIEYHLKNKDVSGRVCVLGSPEDCYYSKLYWESLS